MTEISTQHTTRKRERTRAISDTLRSPRQKSTTDFEGKRGGHGAELLGEKPTVQDLMEKNSKTPLRH